MLAMSNGAIACPSGLTPASHLTPSIPYAAARSDRKIREGGTDAHSVGCNHRPETKTSARTREVAGERTVSRLDSRGGERFWAGRITSGLVVLFLVFDGVGKVLRLDPSVEGTTDLGYPDRLVVWMGMSLLACTALYVIPRTAFLGVILLTGFLGGAVATQVRVQDTWFLFPLAVAVLAWAGLVTRDDRLPALVAP